MFPLDLLFVLAGPLPAHVMHLQNLGGHGDHVGSVWLVVLRLAVEGGVNVLSLVASFGLGTQNSPFREKREPVLWAVGAVPGNWPGWVAGCPAGRCGCWVPWQLLLPFAPSLDSEGRVSAVQPPGCSGQGQGRVLLLYIVTVFVASWVFVSVRGLSLDRKSTRLNSSH